MVYFEKNVRESAFYALKQNLLVNLQPYKFTNVVKTNNGD